MADPEACRHRRQVGDGKGHAHGIQRSLLRHLLYLSDDRASQPTGTVVLYLCWVRCLGFGFIAFSSFCSFLIDESSPDHPANSEDQTLDACDYFILSMSIAS